MQCDRATVKAEFFSRRAEDIKGVCTWGREAGEVALSTEGGLLNANKFLKKTKKWIG
jgi:hypothetical protein